jgi:hypothetical protein
MVRPVDLQVIALFAGIPLLLVTRWLLLGPKPLLTGGRGWLPKKVVIRSAESPRLPIDARRPLRVLRTKLTRLGFRLDLETAHLSRRITPRSHFVFIPFVHADERSLFLAIVEYSWLRASQLMVHVITPFDDEVQVETSSLPILANLPKPQGVRLEMALDVDSVEELWSRHRKALGNIERRLRTEWRPSEWCQVAEKTYQRWLQASVAARLLDENTPGDCYPVRQSFLRHPFA